MSSLVGFDSLPCDESLLRKPILRSCPWGHVLRRSVGRSAESDLINLHGDSPVKGIVHAANVDCGGAFVLGRQVFDKLPKQLFVLR